MSKAIEALKRQNKQEKLTPAELIQDIREFIYNTPNLLRWCDNNLYIWLKSCHAADMFSKYYSEDFAKNIMGDPSKNAAPIRLNFSKVLGFIGVLAEDVWPK